LKHQVHRFDLPVLVDEAKAARKDFQPTGERDPLQRPREATRLLAPRRGDFREIYHLELPGIDDADIIGHKQPDRRGFVRLHQCDEIGEASSNQAKTATSGCSYPRHQRNPEPELGIERCEKKIERHDNSLRPVLASRAELPPHSLN